MCIISVYTDEKTNSVSYIHFFRNSYIYVPYSCAVSAFLRLLEQVKFELLKITETAAALPCFPFFFATVHLCVCVLGVPCRAAQRRAGGFLAEMLALRLLSSQLNGSCPFSRPTSTLRHTRVLQPRDSISLKTRSGFRLRQLYAVARRQLHPSLSIRSILTVTFYWH